MSQSTKRSDNEGFRPDIEGLRGVAVLLVVLFHAGLLSNAEWQLRGGFIGVDVFFVVSGFLITGLLIRERERTGRTSFSKFYARRVRRILPAAAVVLLVFLPVAYALVTLVDRSAVMQDGAAAALSVANVRFALTTDYFNPASYSPFLHFWSLGVEEQFYFVWPAVLAVVAWRRPRLGAAIALSAIVVASFAASLVITADSPSMAFYMLPTRAWQLAAGGLLAVGAGSLARAPRVVLALVRPALAFAGWVAVGALVFAAVTLDSSVPYPGLAALWPTLAAVVLIASGTERAGPGALLVVWPIRFLGKISYSLYLWHWPLLILGGVYFGGSLRPDPFGQTALLTVSQAAGLVALSIVLATASWALVEEPFRRGRVPLPRPSRVVAVGVTVMVVVAMVGASLDFNARGALDALAGPGNVAAAELLPTDEPMPTDAAETRDPGPTHKPGATDPGDLPQPATTPTPGPTAAKTPSVPLLPTPPPATAFALTSSVRPSLANVRKDLEKPWNDNCLGWTYTVTPRNCVYGDPNGKVTVALVGDSHASALFPAVDAAARARGWKLVVYLKIACSFLDMRIVNPELKREYTECATWNDRVIARLKASPPALTLVLQSRWIYPLAKEDETLAREGSAYAREVAKLPGRVAIIVDTPLPTDDVPECLSAHLDDVRKCAVPRWKALGSNVAGRERTAAAATGAALVDINGYICPGSGPCPVVINNMIVYRDGHHLTATYARSLGPALKIQLAAAGLP